MRFSGSTIARLLTAASAAALLQGSAFSQDWPVKQPLNSYGHTGLIDMPSARMMDDGEFALTLAKGPGFFRTTLGFQAFPWLEAGFRYSRLNDYFIGEKRPDLLDRSFSLKLRLWDESEYLPALAVGFQDLIGTGIYGGEYIVASKSLGDFDFTLGLGFGRMGSAGMFRNPLSYIDDRFSQRPLFDPTQSKGGLPLVTSAFRGRDASLFGGVVWQTPIEGLQLMAEYSGDAYRDEESRGIFKPKSQFNFGASYRVSDMVEAGVSYLYGDTVSLRLSFRLDPGTETTKTMDPLPVMPALRPAIREREKQDAIDASASANVAPADLSKLRGNGSFAAGENWALDDVSTRAPTESEMRGSMQDVMNGRGWYDMPNMRDQVINSLKQLALEQGLQLEAIILTADQATVYYHNGQYMRESEAVHRLLRIMTTLPPSVENFTLVSMVHGFPSTQVQLTRSAYEGAVQQFAQADNLIRATTISAAGLSVPSEALILGQAYPRLDWSLVPKPRAYMFDPDQPARFGLSVAASASIDFGDGWLVSGTWTSDLVKATSEAKPGLSVLPHVRTDFRMYQAEGQHGVQSLYVQKTGKLAPEVFYQVRAGLLEDMYAGVGGEVVWRPTGENWAIGANLYWVKQRAFDRMFAFRDYSTITGQVSFYWQDAIWRGVNVNLHAGRYLAGDYGGTIEVTRRFDSGIEIGAFATLTNVPFNDFGEGSFDKGLIIRIPFGWVAPFNTKLEASTYLRSLIRDGGQRLYDVNPLWESLRDTNEQSLRRNWRTDVTPGL